MEVADIPKTKQLIKHLLFVDTYEMPDVGGQ